MMNAPETLFTGNSAKTDATRGTDSISNETFLTVVFQRAHPTARPLLVSFTGNPATVTSTAWTGKAWHSDTDLALQIPPSANNYFSLADFLPDDAGCYRRRKSSFRALHAVMLDDANPKHAHGLNALGYSFAERNLRLNEAYDLVNRALSLAPEDPFIMDSLGWVLYRQGRLESSLAILQKAFGLRPDPEIAAHLGEVLWHMDRKEEALLLWKTTAQSHPENDALNDTIKKFVR